MNASSIIVMIVNLFDLKNARINFLLFVCSASHLCGIKTNPFAVTTDLIHSYAKNEAKLQP